MSVIRSNVLSAFKQKDASSNTFFSGKRESREEKFTWECCTQMERIAFQKVIKKTQKSLFMSEEKGPGPGCWVPLGSASWPHLWLLPLQTVPVRYAEIVVVDP